MIYDVMGNRVNMTRATVDIASSFGTSSRIIGAAELKMNEKLEPGEVEGASSIPVGYTDGPWSGTFGFKAPLAEMLAALQAMGGSFGKAILTAGMSFDGSDSSDGVMTLNVLGARITSVDFDGGDRSKASMIAVECKLLTPSDWNGVSITDAPDVTAGLGGFILSF